MSFSIKSLAQTIQFFAILLLIWLAIGLLWQLLPTHRATATLRLAQAAPSISTFNPEAVLRLFKTSSAVSQENLPLTLNALISGRDGIAIIAGLEASAVAVKVGGEVGQYGKLIAAKADHIVLEQQGQQRKVYLSASAVAKLPSQGMQPNTPTTAEGQSAPAAGITLTWGQLTGVLQGGNLANWSKGLGTSQAGGIAVEQASQQQLAQVLQLRDGDVLKAINGRPLNKLDDLSLLYGAFSQQTHLSLLILRQDQPQTISYTVNP